MICAMPNCDPVTLMLGGMTVRKSTFYFKNIHSVILYIL